MIDAGPDELQATVADAFIYAYPMLFNYKTLHEQALDPAFPGYVGGFGRFRHYSRVYTPADTDIVTVGGAAGVKATDAVGIFANTQIVTSSTVVKTDGGQATVQDKINKFLPSDYSTDPNEPQSATVLGNLVKNRNDLLPDQVKALGDKFNAAKDQVLEQVSRAKSLADEALADVTAGVPA